MKKICVALCFSLFASLIHAAVMPMDTVGHATSLSAVTQDQSIESHCHEVSSDHHESHFQQSKQTESTKQLCHGDNYQCCLGLVVAPPIDMYLSTSLSNHLVPMNVAWVISPMAYLIDKPPKYIL